MKTRILLFLLLLCSAMVSAQVKRVAILETVDKENKVDYAYKLLLRSNLSKAITNISGYEAYDRTDIDAIMTEQNFQRTGLVSNDQIKRLGEMTGANYILVAEVANSGNQFIILAKLLDIETARTIMTDHEITTINNMQNACEKLAQRMFHEEVKEEPIIETKLELIRHTAQEQKLLGIEKYSYGSTQMDEKAFCLFMQQNNREAYLKYIQSKPLIPAGWVLLGGGTALMACAIYATCDGIDGMMACCYSIGVCALGASIPLLSVGYTRQKNAIKMFNEQNSIQEPALSLNLQASQNGVGLALSF
mgnify:FL=1